MINLKHKVLLTAAAAVSASLYMNAAGAANVTANASANIHAPLTIGETTAMHFGDIGLAAGNVTISAAGARSTTGPELITGAGLETAALFTVGGSGNLAYSITLPASTTVTNGTSSPTVNAFNHNAGGAPALAAGSDTFNVGATLVLTGAEDTTTTAYTGTYTVTVNYQ